MMDDPTNPAVQDATAGVPHASPAYLELMNKTKAELAALAIEAGWGENKANRSTKEMCALFIMERMAAPDLPTIETDDGDTVPTFDDVAGSAGDTPDVGSFVGSLGASWPTLLALAKHIKQLTLLQCGVQVDVSLILSVVTVIGEDCNDPDFGTIYNIARQPQSYQRRRFSIVLNRALGLIAKEYETILDRHVSYSLYNACFVALDAASRQDEQLERILADFRLLQEQNRESYQRYRNTSQLQGPPKLAPAVPTTSGGNNP